jgi:hypothetical protein
MNPKFLKSNGSLRAVVALVFGGVLAVVPATRGAEQTVMDDIAVGRDEVKASRTAVVAEAMQLSEEEGQAFWPLYSEYRAAMDRINDGLIKLILEYADVYPNVPEDRARQMLKDYTDLEKKSVATRAAYLKKIARTLTAVKALRFAQVENRLDLAVRQQLAGILPLVPVPAK